MATINPVQIKTSKGLEIEIMSAQPSEAADIIAYVNRIITESDFLLISPGEFTMTVADEEKYIHSINESKDALFLLAKHNQKIIGVISTKTFEARKKMDHNCDLGMSISKDYWGQGVGDAAFGLLVDYYKKSGNIEKFNLEVFSNNIKAKNLYKKHGFVEEGRDSKKYRLESGDYIDNIRMSLWVGKE